VPPALALGEGGPGLGRISDSDGVRWNQQASGAGFKYSLTGDDGGHDFWGFARGARGLFSVSEDGLRQVELLGCTPHGRLLASLGHLGGRRARAGNANLALLDIEGIEMGAYFVNDVTPTAAKPSTLGADLLDVTVQLWCDQMLPGSDWMWELIRTGQLKRKGLWHSLDQPGRRAWLSVALWSSEYQRRANDAGTAPDRVFVLDGRQILDVDSFYCAIGEAVNGPGGYFGWNLDALNDCLRGDWGAAPPFTLEWRYSEVSRSRLVEHPALQGDGTTLFELILNIIGENDIQVDLQ
jgi:RNAse (barnase) inhibitor barstar